MVKLFGSVRWSHTWRNGWPLGVVQEFPLFWHWFLFHL
jgi:hypothetical protein